MAEQETANTEETDVAIGDSGEVKKLLGLPQPLLIKIAAGLVVVIIAVVAYLFLMPADEEETVEEPAVEAISEESTDDEMATDFIDQDNLIADPTDNEGDNAEIAPTSSDTQVEIDAIKAEVTELNEQNTILKDETVSLREKIAELEATVNTYKEEAQKQRGEAALNNYANDYEELPPIQTEPPKPRPKPSWGEFKRAL